MKKQKNNFPPLLIFFAVPILNFLGSFIGKALGLPLFFDSFGTIAGVMLSGLWTGALGGVVYNLLSAILSQQYASFIWALSSVFIAVIVWQLLKTRKLKMESYESIFMSGIVLAIFNALFTTLVSLLFFHGTETFPPAVFLQNFLATQLDSSLLTLTQAHMLLEIIDKSLVFLIIFGVYKLLRQNRKPDLKALAMPAVVLVATILFTAWINVHQKMDIRRQEMDHLIKNQTQQAVSMLETVYEGYKDGMYPLDQAKSMAADLLRYLRYGDNNEGYFWADTSDGTNVVLYGRKDVEGKNRMNSNVCGVYHVREIIANGKQVGGGYTEYYYPKKDGSKPLAKRGYSLYFQPFDWIVGTGYYLEDLK